MANAGPRRLKRTTHGLRLWTNCNDRKGLAMQTVSRILSSIRDAALAREPGPVFLVSFLVISALLFAGAFYIGEA